MIYLDNMSSTPLDPKVAVAMEPYLLSVGNPHAGHQLGSKANDAISMAAEQVATLINSTAKEIIFTSGTTESNNLAIKGACYFYQGKGRHIITCKTEHKSVLEPILSLQREGYDITILDVDQHGLVDINELRNSITPETILISIMYVNNEIGVIQPIEAIGKLAKEHGIIFHVDGAQALGKLAVDVKKNNISLLSFSGHKIYGPMGIGGLYVNSSPKVRLKPLLLGGGQQYGIRSGTVPVPLVVGLGAACSLISDNLLTETARIKGLSEYFIKEIIKLNGVIINGCMRNKVQHNINLSIQGIDIESLLLATRDIAYSRASACMTFNQDGSYVLRALGLSPELTKNSLRISIGRFTTLDEMQQALASLTKSIIKLRQISGWKIDEL